MDQTSLYWKLLLTGKIEILLFYIQSRTEGKVQSSFDTLSATYQYSKTSSTTLSERASETAWVLTVPIPALLNVSGLFRLDYLTLPKADPAEW